MKNLFEELHEENMVMLLHTLSERTKQGKQKWNRIDYNPISFLQSVENENEAVISQCFEADTCLNGLVYQIELTESIDCVTGKGDIFGCLTCEDQQIMPAYDFGLSYQIRKYDDVNAEQLQEVFQDDAIVELANALVSIFSNTDEVTFGFSYARYYNQTDIKKAWKSNKLVKMGKKLMEEKRMEDFHRSLLDIPYREMPLSE